MTIDTILANVVAGDSSTAPALPPHVPNLLAAASAQAADAQAEALAAQAALTTATSKIDADRATVTNALDQLGKGDVAPILTNGVVASLHALSHAEQEQLAATIAKALTDSFGLAGNHTTAIKAVPFLAALPAKHLVLIGIELVNKSKCFTASSWKQVVQLVKAVQKSPHPVSISTGNGQQVPKKFQPPANAVTPAHGQRVLDRFDPTETAAFIIQDHFSHPDGPILRHYRDAWHIFVRTHYEPIPEATIIQMIRQYLARSLVEIDRLAGTFTVPFKPQDKDIREVKHALIDAVLITLPAAQSIPCWINQHGNIDTDPNRPLSHEIISFNNGLLDLRAFQTAFDATPTPML